MLVGVIFPRIDTFICLCREEEIQYAIVTYTQNKENFEGESHSGVTGHLLP